MTPIFITGIGTDVGKTIVSTILVNALEADYWKPVQAGLEDTDRDFVAKYKTPNTQCFHETYRLAMPASPHIAAKSEGIEIDTDKIVANYLNIKENSPSTKYLIIEGAGGMYVPLNDTEFVIDLVKKLNAGIILVSKNYLGSINHSMLTAAVCKANNLHVIGWIFNGDYLNYEQEIAAWTGFPVIGKIPEIEKITKETIYDQSLLIKEKLLELLQQ